MIRLVIFLITVLAIASGLAWVADRPGSLVLNWQGYEIETSVFRAIVILSLMIAAAMLVWTGLRTVWMSPALLGRYMRKQRQRKGLDALSTGMIAISAGDQATASKYAVQAHKSLPNEPLTHLLRAQTAHLNGDRATAKRIYESMLSAPDTEQLGLRGLYLEATELNEPEAARHFAQRALAANPALAWPVDATFEHQCQEKNWVGALETLATARRYGHVDKATADRRRAVLLTAQAQVLEDARPDEALKLALDAHGLAKDLVPAAAIAGRIHAGKGNTGKAAKILQKTWTLAPHPDLATAYAYARIGDSPKDRFERVKKLASMNQKSVEGPIALAHAAVEARDYAAARHALNPLLDDRLTQRVATLMARIEGEENGDKGRVREWLARAVTAGRDPAWTADGIVSEDWAPVSPVSGKLDAFEWRTPVERAPGHTAQSITAKAEDLIAVLAAAQQQPAIEVSQQTTRSAPENADTNATQSKPEIVVDVDASERTNTTALTGATRSRGDATDSADDDQKASTRRDTAKVKPASDSDELRQTGEHSPNPKVGAYTSKTGHKKKKKFQHTQASVAIKPEASQPEQSTRRSDSSSQSGLAKAPQPAKSSKSDRPAEPFVTPRAPDDPGPEGGGLDPTPKYKAFRPVSS